MKTLAIETSCDDTSIALVSYKEGIFVVEYMQTTDQLKTHNAYGGVVPQLAYDKHAENILPLIEQMLGEYGKKVQDEIDFITVTGQPGLPGSLRVGITAAYTLGALWQKPVVEVHHILGHVFSTLIDRSFDDLSFPYLALTVSGGHSDLYLVEKKPQATSHKPQAGKEKKKEKTWTKRQHISVGNFLKAGPFFVTKLGQTIDDAAGEAFDKVARMLGGPYPGGAWIGQMAEQGGPDERVAFRPSYLKKEEYNFSFSGLKSQAYYLLETYKKEGIELDDMLKANIARAFQEAITDVLVKKTIQCMREYEAKTLGLVGGVSANKSLREKLKAKIGKLQAASKFILPSEFLYCMDNAGMIGVVGLLEEMEKGKE